jgi:hypothetical protein
VITVTNNIDTTDSDVMFNGPPRTSVSCGYDTFEEQSTAVPSHTSTVSPETSAPPSLHQDAGLINQQHRALGQVDNVLVVLEPRHASLLATDYVPSPLVPCQQPTLPALPRPSGQQSQSARTA